VWRGCNSLSAEINCAAPTFHSEPEPRKGNDVSPSMYYNPKWHVFKPFKAFNSKIAGRFLQLFFSYYSALN